MARPKTRKGDYTNYSFWLDMELRKQLEAIAWTKSTTLPRLIEQVLKDFVENQKS